MVSNSPSRFFMLATSKKPPQMREFLAGRSDSGFNGFEHVLTIPNLGFDVQRRWLTFRRGVFLAFSVASGLSLT